MKVRRVEIAPAIAAGLGAGDERGCRSRISSPKPPMTPCGSRMRLKEAVDREAAELGIEGLGDQLGGLLQ